MCCSFFWIIIIQLSIQNRGKVIVFCYRITYTQTFTLWAVSIMFWQYQDDESKENGQIKSCGFGKLTMPYHLSTKNNENGNWCSHKDKMKIKQITKQTHNGLLNLVLRNFKELEKQETRAQTNTKQKMMLLMTSNSLLFINTGVRSTNEFPLYWLVMVSFIKG